MASCDAASWSIPLSFGAFVEGESAKSQQISTNKNQLIVVLPRNGSLVDFSAPEPLSEGALPAEKVSQTDSPEDAEAPELSTEESPPAKEAKQNDSPEDLAAPKPSNLKPPPAKKARLEVPATSQNKPAKSNKNKFIYGNYDRYYGYRNASEEDLRVTAFKSHPHLFADKTILDVGCNHGAVTVAVARDFNPKFVTGIDIDKTLIANARKQITKEKHRKRDATGFPNNIAFRQCNYVLSDERLLEIEHQQFDTILCLSVTKWIHLNFGDAGLKLTFKRMFKQLNEGGHLILEAQEWKGYKKRKNLTPEISRNYKSIELLPRQFEQYLLKEVGFAKVFDVELPRHSVKGFQRPVRVFQKGCRIDETPMAIENESSESVGKAVEPLPQ